MMISKTSQQYRNLGYSQGEIVALRDLFTSLSKGVRASRQYPSNHPIPTQFQSLFFRKLSSFFESTTVIAVKVAHETLTADEEVVFRSALSPENIAGLLHRDGIRSLEIDSGITEEEATAFFDALVVCSGRDEGAEDVVNLFWQSGFEHVKYDVVDVFEISEMQDLREEFDSTRLPARLDPLSVDNDEPPFELSKAQTEQLADLSGYSTEEIASLKRMVELDRTLDARGHVIDLLLLLCESAKSSQELSQAVDALQSVFDKSIRAADFARASDVLHRIRVLLGSDEMSSPSMQKRLSDFVNRCGDSFRIKLIVEALNRHEDADLKSVRQYLSELGWESFNHLLWMLGELERRAPRQMLCDLLVEKGLDKIDLLGSAVFDSRWYLVRNVVWVLGETGHPRALSFLRKAAAHADMRVRTEVIRALGKIPDPARIELLLELAQDNDDKIRVLAVEELGKSESEAAFQGIRDIVLSKGFLNAPTDEMRKMLEAMVVSGGAAAVKTAGDILARTPLLNRAAVHHLQDQVLVSLKYSNTSDATVLLGKLANNAKSRYCQNAKRILTQRQSSRERRTDHDSA